MHTSPGLLVYAKELTPRVKYAFRLVLTTCLGLEVEFSSNKEELPAPEKPLINYSGENLPGAFQVVPCGLLHETGLKPQQPEVHDWKNLPVFYRTSDTASLSFDLFSAAFFLATRYEEYLSFEPDIHGRFRARDSFAFRHGFLQKPILHLWANELKKLLQENFPGLDFPEARYRYIPTMDVDVALAYRAHGFVRSTGGLIRSLLKGDLRLAWQRCRVLAGREKDPYDTYEYFDSLNDRYNLTPAVFFAVGDNSEFDKNLDYRNPTLRKLISRLSCRYRSGLHPSCPSWKNSKTLLAEKTRLELITHRKVIASRQHYLKLAFPETYRSLLHADIEKDFTMGYADLPGFRAGMCFPYPWYDLKAEKETRMEIWPFQVMDGTLNHYMKLSPGEAVEKTKEIIDSVKEVNGIFISLWHNSSLSELQEWKGWKKVYEEIVSYAAQP